MTQVSWTGGEDQNLHRTTINTQSPLVHVKRSATSLGTMIDVYMERDQVLIGALAQ